MTTDPKRPITVQEAALTQEQRREIDRIVTEASKSREAAQKSIQLLTENLPVFRAALHNDNVLLGAHQSRPLLGRGVQLAGRLRQWFEEVDASTARLIGGFDPDCLPSERPAEETVPLALQAPRQAATEKFLTLAAHAAEIEMRLRRAHSSLPKGSSGRVRQDALVWLVENLAAVWEELTGKRFRSSKKSGNNAANFVQQVVRVVDPKISATRTATTIRHVVKQRTNHSALRHAGPRQRKKRQ